jgi:hypothetical protein
MTPSSKLHRGWAGLIRLIALEITNMPPRIDRALEVLSDARSPLRANSYEAIGTSNGGPDPGTTAIAAQADRDRKQLIHHIREIDALVRGITHILDEWAPQQGATNETFWCDNHQTYGYQEPRGLNRTRNCGWCCDVHRTWNVWPTRALIELHAKGRRITETEYRRLLGKGPGVGAA